MMSSGSVVMESTNNRNEGNKRLPCTFYSCKRVYSDENSLQNHLKDHEIPAQSLPGKTMMCSIIGCSGSFPNMQKLMEHLRHHHKPNIYFLCESCHAKLRSYRGLLHHLRSCAKAPRPKIPPSNPSPSSSTPPAPMEVDPTKPTTSPQDNLSPAPAPPATPQLPLVLNQSTNPPVLTQSNNAPVLSPNQDLAPPHLIQQIIDSTVNSIFSQDNSHLFPVLDSQPRASLPETPQGLKTPENPGPLKMTPHIPPTNAWKCNQGGAPERRILWQHTRGRYRCVQCGHTVTNRKEMTEHSALHSDSVGPKEETTTNPPATSS